MKNAFAAAALAALTVAFAHTAAQEPPQPPAGPGAGRQGRGGRGIGVFPAQQRPPADPAVIDRGKTIYGINCTPCHGADARGGQLGGPNLLR